MTIEEKLNVLLAKTAARKQAESDEAAAAQALAVSSGADDAALAEGQSVASIAERVVYAVVRGDVVKLALQGYAPPTEFHPTA